MATPLKERLYSRTTCAQGAFELTQALKLAWRMCRYDAYRATFAAARSSLCPWSGSVAGYPAMPPVYVATGLSVNSTIAYCSGAGVFPFPVPGVALAIPVSIAPNTNIIPIVMELALIRCADVPSPPLVGEPTGARRQPDVLRPQKRCAKSNAEFRSFGIR